MVGPGVARIEHVVRHARHGVRNRKPEKRFALEGRILQAAVDCGIDHRARVGDRHPLTDAVGAPGPAGVDEPAGHAMLRDALTEQLRIHGGLVHHERRAETGRERCGRFEDALLGAGNLCRVAREEVVHRLFGRELGNRRQHPEGVGRQHHDRLRMSRHEARHDVRNEVDRVCRARVLGLGFALEI